MKSVKSNRRKGFNLSSEEKPFNTGPMDKYGEKTRLCLMCSKSFISKGIQNRRCLKCARAILLKGYNMETDTHYKCSFNSSDLKTDNEDVYLVNHGFQ